MKACEWCGHEHDVTALCTQRPTWGRRGFLALMGAAIVGAALPSVPLLESIVEPLWLGERIAYTATFSYSGEMGGYWLAVDPAMKQVGEILVTWGSHALRDQGFGKDVW